MSNTIKKLTNFTTITNKFLRDDRLSFKAKGLFCYMFSMADDWNFTIQSIAKQQKDGQASIISAMNELKKLGYMTYTKYANGSGVYSLNCDGVEPDANLENPNLENPNLENPNLENPIVLRINNPTEEKLIRKTITKKNNKSSDFDLFWEAYPKKRDKAYAEKAFIKQKKDLPTIQDLLLSIEKYKNSENVQKGFIKNPATWLNAQAWLDEYDISNSNCWADDMEVIDAF